MIATYGEYRDHSQLAKNVYLCVYVCVCVLCVRARVRVRVCVLTVYIHVTALVINSMHEVQS